MGITPDRFDGPSLEEEIQLEDRTADGNPTANGAIRFVSGDIVAKLPSGVYSLTAAAAGITDAQHKALRQLIHFIEDGPAEGFASGAFKQTAGTVFPTAEIWYVVGSTPPAGKIVELLTTWTGPVITQEIWKMYDVDGSTVLVTVTDTITYSGLFETSRTRTIA